MWTKGSLLTFRRDRRWPELEARISDEVVAILNDGRNAMTNTRGLSDIEPAVGFKVDITGGGDE